MSKRYIDKLRLTLASPAAFRWIVAFFLIQSLLSVIFISPSTPKDGVGGHYVERNEDGVVPDGHRHLGAIYYYAKQPILRGPSISDMPEEDLWMGDLTRFPSYFYYYVLGFPVRIAMAFGATDIQIIYLVRLIGTCFGLLALFVFRRIVRLVTSSTVVQNLSILALASTGSFVWLSAAENYDIMALLVWFAYIYSSMSLFVRKDAKYLYWMSVWFFVLGVTKYTYIPFALIFGLIAAITYTRNKKRYKNMILSKLVLTDIRKWVRKMRTWRVILGVLVLLCVAGLFTERIGGNLIVYHSFNPSCTKLHSQEGCMKFGVYARNYTQKVLVKNGTAEPIEYIPVVGYPAFWIKRYFDSMYVYMGHIYIPRYSLLIELAGIFVAIIGVVMLILAKIKKVRIFRDQTEVYLFAIVIFLTVTQFVFNLNTILNTAGQPYAHQGRYLLSVIGFFYILYIVMIRRVIDQQSPKIRYIIQCTAVGVAVYALIVASAIPSFLIHADHSEWYGETARAILPGWIVNRR